MFLTCVALFPLSFIFLDFLPFYMKHVFIKHCVARSYFLFIFVLIQFESVCVLISVFNLSIYIYCNVEYIMTFLPFNIVIFYLMFILTFKISFYFSLDSFLKLLILFLFFYWLIPNLLGFILYLIKIMLESY